VKPNSNCYEIAFKKNRDAASKEMHRKCPNVCQVEPCLKGIGDSIENAQRMKIGK
jgi:hypothetical protein